MKEDIYDVDEALILPKLIRVRKPGSYISGFTAGTYTQSLNQTPCRATYKR